MEFNSTALRPLIVFYDQSMKTEKEKFDRLLHKLLTAKPGPRKDIKTTGKRGTKTPILAK
jgi:hypothetical protein